MTAVVTSLVGVYDADGTIVGELRYWLGARVGTAHCELCVISHGTFRAKRDWRSFVEACAVPFVTHHRDDAPSDVLAALGPLAAVGAVTSDGVVLLLGPDELEVCGGDVARFAQRLADALAANGLPAVSAPAAASPD